MSKNLIDSLNLSVSAVIQQAVRRGRLTAPFFLLTFDLQTIYTNAKKFFRMFCAGA